MIRLVLGAALLVALAVPAHGASERARRLARRILVADTHIDVPYRLYHRMEDISGRTGHGEFDWVRAREGGLDAAFMSIFTPASLEGQGRSREVAEQLIDMIDSIAAAHPDRFAIATTPDDVEFNFDHGIVSLCLGMENGSPIEGDLANIARFYERGVRYVTLTHARDNLICDSSYDTTRTWGGLSEFGRRVVEEMNRVGIMIDVSHVSDDAFWQVLRLSKAPVIASHSSCRHFVPGFERNLSDEMIVALARAGGVVQVNFGSTFVSDAARRWADAHQEARRRAFAGRDVSRRDAEVEAWERRWRAEHPLPRATVGTVADHVMHVVAIAGVEHVGFGSDFDGVGDTLPEGLRDVADYPNLIDELLRRGLSEADVERIAWKNLARVWRDVERVARDLREGSGTD